MTVARVLFISLLTFFASAALAIPDEPIAIADIVADPDPYHLRLVTLHGTVRQVKALEPYSQTSGTACYGAYTFTLEDDTGVIGVAVLGVCGKPMIKAPDVFDGERVLVQAQVLAPGHSGPSGESGGRIILGGDQDKVRAVANVISHLGE